MRIIFYLSLVGLVLVGGALGYIFYDKIHSVQEGEPIINFGSARRPATPVETFYLETGFSTSTDNTFLTGSTTLEMADATNLTMLLRFIASTSDGVADGGATSSLNWKYYFSDDDNDWFQETAATTSVKELIQHSPNNVTHHLDPTVTSRGTYDVSTAVTITDIFADYFSVVFDTDTGSGTVMVNFIREY